MCSGRYGYLEPMRDKRNCNIRMLHLFLYNNVVSSRMDFEYFYRIAEWARQ